MQSRESGGTFVVAVRLLPDSGMSNDLQLRHQHCEQAEHLGEGRARALHVLQKCHSNLGFLFSNL